MRIYLIAKIRGGNNNRPIKFRIIDIDTEEVRDVSKDELAEAIEQNKSAFINVGTEVDEVLKQSIGVEMHEIVTKEDIDEIPTLDMKGCNISRTKYIILSIDEAKNSLKLIESDGEIIDMDLRYAYGYANEVANIPEKYRKPRWKGEVIPTDAEKELQLVTDSLYKAFILKTRMLGLDCGFTYEINRNDVILQSYTGTSTHALVPKFVTIIGNGAFQERGLTNLSLNDGLKTIVQSAFAHNDIAEVDIPKTVTSIGKNAFIKNRQLFSRQLFNRVLSKDEFVLELNTNKFRIHSERTRIKDQG